MIIIFSTLLLVAVALVIDSPTIQQELKSYVAVPFF
jgi:hypothetical protein